VKGLAPELVWHEMSRWGDFDAVVLPRRLLVRRLPEAGAIAARSPAISKDQEDGGEGVPRPGDMQRFQILVEAGLLPGPCSAIPD